MNKERNNEATEQFAKIWKEYNDPLFIKKRLNEKKREEILKDKKSSFCLEENEQ